MPELPEVETVMRGLSPALKNQQIVALEIRSKSLRIPIPSAKIKKLLSKKIIRLRRRAKYILIDFSGGMTLVAHLGMTGSFTIFPPSRHKEIKLDRHDHIILTTDKNDKIIYRDPRRFGMIDVFKTEEIDIYPALRNLGYEPLDKNFTAKHLHEKLKGRSIAIKPAIMDQKLVVGVGNIYASEALYLSGIDPRTPAGEISLKKLETLTEKIKDILSRAIKSGGSTLRDYRSTGGEMGYFQFQFSVYDREGEACAGCTCSLKRTGGIQRIVQAGRSTFYCPTKQK
jgi:formamidopyrimidine-DNA glycosylase